MAREDNIQVYDTALRYHLALLGSPHLAEDKVSEVLASAQETVRDLLTAFQPWLKQDKATAQDQTIASLIAAYKEKCGDPSDPKFMQALRESIAARAKEREARRKQRLDPDDILQQRLAARDRRLHQPPVRKPRRGRT